MPKCVQCGSDLPLIDAHALWRDGKRICRNCAGKSEPVERPPAPLVGESDVWFPVLLLVAMIILGLFSWIIGLLALIAATVYVHYNSKKFGIEGGRSIITLLFAIVGLPLYTYDLHKLRNAQQTNRLRTVIEPVPSATPSMMQQTPITSQAPAIVPPTKFCRECGAKIPRDSMYCEECGTRLV